MEWDQIKHNHAHALRISVATSNCVSTTSNERGGRECRTAVKESKRARELVLFVSFVLRACTWRKWLHPFTSSNLLKSKVDYSSHRPQPKVSQHLATRIPFIFPLKISPGRVTLTKNNVTLKTKVPWLSVHKRSPVGLNFGVGTGPQTARF